MKSTIAAIATPPGRGGIGIIRISGPRALALASEITELQGEWRPRFAHFAKWHDEQGHTIDAGLVLFFPAPRSFTGEDVIELHGHGNPLIQQVLIDRLIELGASAAAPGEFCRRAVENGKMDLSQAEAVAATVEAATLRASHQAQRHLSGEFGQAVDALMNSLTSMLAHVEACIDFPDEDIPSLLFDDMCKQANEMLNRIDVLLATADFGERLFSGANVAIVGAPNVGKSSLLNTLSGRSRAIVSETAGTTRDTLEVDFDIHGVPMRLVDTAGLRASSDVVEQEGIRRAEQAAGIADLVLFVADATRSDTWSEPGKRANTIRVMNKVDIADPSDIPAGFLPVSAKTGAGFEQLNASLAKRLGELDAFEETLMITSSRHREAMSEARRHLEHGASLLHQAHLELVAAEWRLAWRAMGGILGLGDVEEILDRIFSEFCIGK